MDKSFELREELQKLQQHASEYFIPNELDIEHWNEEEIEVKLNELTDSWGEDSSAIADPILFDIARSYIKKFGHLSDRAKNKLILVVLTGLKSQLSHVKDDDENDMKNGMSDKKDALKGVSRESLVSAKPFLILYMFLLAWMIENIEADGVSKTKRAAESPLEEPPEGYLKTRKAAAAAAAAGGTKHKKVKDAQESDVWVWARHKQSIIEIMHESMQFDFNEMCELKTEKDSFVRWVTGEGYPVCRFLFISFLGSLYTKTCYTLLSSSDITKEETNRNTIFDILAICVKKYEHGYGKIRNQFLDGVSWNSIDMNMDLAAETSIMQSLRYMEHLAEPIVDFLDILAKKYQIEFVADEILL
jgi:hypothetical protein